MRIKKHPILDFQSRKKISFYFNDKKMQGQEGDSVASALYANGVKKFSTSIKYERDRGFFCGIGKCSSCLMRVDDIPNVRTCTAPLKEGLKVERQREFADLPKKEFGGQAKEEIDVDVLVVGAGPAGLSAAIEAAENNTKVLLIDENQRVGGQLIKQTHKFFGSKQEKAGARGIKIADKLKQQIEEYVEKGNVRLMLDSTVIGYYENEDEEHKLGVVKREDYESSLYEVNCESLIFATGAMENMLLFPGNDLPGVYGAGAVQTLMNVYGVKPGRKVVMVGAGNVGLIVAYQLLQAGIEVDRVVEAMPHIGGYHVHAAKLRRCGVPIYTSCSIKKVLGDRKVEKVVTVNLDENWKPVEGTEETVDCDTVCLAVGLTPSTRLLSQIGVENRFISEAGGYVALHDKNMETTVGSVFVAGDSSGIEEASTAMIEGKIAGLSAVDKTGFEIKDFEEKRKKYREEIERLRAGPFGEKPRKAKEKINKNMLSYLKEEKL
ncbi:MAG: FAD-dependent oxidoreductase [Candidatus Thermoplasmatota archaeon]